MEENTNALHVSQDIRKNQLHQVYRMYDNDRIDSLCSADSHTYVFLLATAKLNVPNCYYCRYNIPYRTKVGESSALLFDEFPPLLRGYISASFYTEV